MGIARSSFASLFLAFLYSLLLQRPTSAAKKAYVVYLGGHSPNAKESSLHSSKRVYHRELLASVLGNKEKAHMLCSTLTPGTSMASQRISKTRRQWRSQSILESSRCFQTEGTSLARLDHGIFLASRGTAESQKNHYGRRRDSARTPSSGTLTPVCGQRLKASRMMAGGPFPPSGRESARMVQIRLLHATGLLHTPSHLLKYYF